MSVVFNADTQPVAAALTLPHAVVAAATQIGDPRRSVRLRRRLSSGRALRSVALGGSSTSGHQLSRTSPLLYHARVAEWLRSLSAAAAKEHQHTNGGTPAIGPEYSEKCLDTLLVGAPDLAFVEFAQNLQDKDSSRALERLVRRLLQLPTSPAVVMVDLPTWKSMSNARDHQREMVPKLAAHYGLPYLSLQRLVGELDRSNTTSVHGWHPGAWLQCGNSTRACRAEAAPHPNKFGHQLIATAIVHLLERTWQAPLPSLANSTGIPPPLMTRPSSRAFSSVFTPTGWRASSGASSLVPNYELDSAVCVGPDHLSSYVEHAHNWTFVREGTKLHPKPGYVATDGEENDLSLCYPVTSICKDVDACVGRTVLVAIGFLKSYDTRMGTARIWCTGGCSCEENSKMKYDGRHNQQNSVTYNNWLATKLSDLAFSKQKCPCSVHVKAVPRSRSRHSGAARDFRFKVTMMMLSHEGEMKWIDPWKTLWQNVGDSAPNLR